MSSSRCKCWHVHISSDGILHRINLTLKTIPLPGYLLEVLSKFLHWEGTKDQVSVKPMANRCEVWSELWATVAFDLEGQPEKLVDGGSVWRRAWETLGLRCTACEVWLGV
ncbi:uncharacterized protein ARMOST_14388 [Armillaria ostoyae]|uniref:Uncharacterized protein n=1 Tax=Armillaria ostoyae TaxID=47428 RepID=A0A284RQH0_ARMOS|nr:uncharacterized protein ARMOST_14388 [Armillaria ostoyae]